MADYSFTEQAERDIEEITDYTVQQWGIAQTVAYLDGLEARVQFLANNPQVGTNREALFAGLLSFPYESNILYYVKQSNGIAIVRVLHQRMDPVQHL